MTEFRTEFNAADGALYGILRTQDGIVKQGDAVMTEGGGSGRFIGLTPADVAIISYGSKNSYEADLAAFNARVARFQAKEASARAARFQTIVKVRLTTTQVGKVEEAVWGCDLHDELEIGATYIKGTVDAVATASDWVGEREEDYVDNISVDNPEIKISALAFAEKQVRGCVQRTCRKIDAACRKALTAPRPASVGMKILF